MKIMQYLKDILEGFHKKQAGAVQGTLSPSPSNQVTGEKYWVQHLFYLP